MVPIPATDIHARSFCTALLAPLVAAGLLLSSAMPHSLHRLASGLSHSPSAGWPPRWRPITRPLTRRTSPRTSFLHTHSTLIPIPSTRWHIPGPNPIISPRPPAASWQSHECEIAGGVTKVEDTYYCIYHCLSNTQGYQVGVSSAKSPLGPWTPPADKPMLAVSPGKWDKDVVASMNIMPDPAKPGHWLGSVEKRSGEACPVLYAVLCAVLYAVLCAVVCCGRVLIHTCVSSPSSPGTTKGGRPLHQVLRGSGRLALRVRRRRRGRGGRARRTRS